MGFTRAIFVASYCQDCHSTIVKVRKRTKSGKDTYRILGECLLISSLQGKALRTLVDIGRLVKI